MTVTATAVEQVAKDEIFTVAEFEELVTRFAKSGEAILPVLESMAGSMFDHDMSSGCIRDSLARAVAGELARHATALDKERGVDKLGKLSATEKDFLQAGFNALVGDALHNGLIDWENSTAREKEAT
jgi:hypothetical protein